MVDFEAESRIKEILRGLLQFIFQEMRGLSNVFSVLNLIDDDDDTGQKTNPIKSDKEKKKGETSGSNITLRIGEKQESLQDPLEEYKLPLVWIDLEMTGLNVEVDRILEIACVITDGKLTKSVEGPDLVIRQSKESLDSMGEWCQEHHAASGLTERVLQSTITELDAEKQALHVMLININGVDLQFEWLINEFEWKDSAPNPSRMSQVVEFVKRYVGSETPLLAGNSVYVDLLFLKKYMPDLASLFSHVLVDVSSVAALCSRWFPKARRKAPSKEKNHRAMDDIKESIRELKYYKESIFKSTVGVGSKKR